MPEKEPVKGMSPTEPNAGRFIQVPAGAETVDGLLTIPANAQGIVLFTDGSGKSRDNDIFRSITRGLAEAGIATLLLNLLTPDEESLDEATGYLRFNTSVHAQRILGAASWLAQHYETNNLRIGYYGVGLGAAATAAAAAMRPDLVGAMVAQAGRLDLKEIHLAGVQTPTLLISGEKDTQGIHRNQVALEQLQGATHKEFQIVPNSNSRFDTPEGLKEVVRLASVWFTRYLVPIR